MDGVFKETYKLSACDVDFTDRWKLQSLLEKAQEAANDQCVGLGAGRNEMIDKYNAAFILARTYLEIYKYPRNSEQAVISTWPKDGSHHILVRFFKIEDENGELIGRMISHWAVLDLTKRALVSPDSMGFKMPDTSNIPDLMDMPRRIPCGYEDPDTMEITARYSDIDILGHVNNTKYVEWICDFLGSGFFKQNTICSLDIKYSREVTEGEPLRLEMVKRDIPECEDGKSFRIFVRGVSEKNGATNFESVLRAMKTN